MADVSAKQITGTPRSFDRNLLMGRRAFALLKAGRLPKGDAISLARRGVMAAKRTPDLLPLCHPLSLDSVDVEITLDASLPGAHVRCTAAVAAKTGVEMEALTGCSAALLCLYDLLKPVDPVLEIVAVRLEYKSGGKKGYWRHPKTHTPPKAAMKRPKLGTAAVITVSDRAFKKIYQDTSGPALASGLQRIGFSIKKRIISPDDQTTIETHIRRAAGVNVVVLTGGTGLSCRDVTRSRDGGLRPPNSRHRRVLARLRRTRDRGAVSLGRRPTGEVRDRRFAGKRGRSARRFMRPGGFIAACRTYRRRRRPCP